MAEVTRRVEKHSCYDELDELDITDLGLGSGAVCSCGAQYVLCEQQIDGPYWALDTREAGQ